MTSGLVVLDNEAVHALTDPAHSKHVRVIAHIQVVAHRKKRAVDIRIVVPTSVRVEAGWDRTNPAAAFVNRLRIDDAPLDAAAADAAARLRTAYRVSVADAHIGAVVEHTPAQHITVITSDPGDIGRVVRTSHVVIVKI